MRTTHFVMFLAVVTIAIILPGFAAEDLIGQEAAQTPSPRPAANAYDEVARFISGLPCTSEPLKTLQENPEWKNLAEALGRNWGELNGKRLQLMKAWAGAEMAEANATTRVLFYPFGGPDLLTAFLLFPNADAYVLLGLEFVGKLPDFEQAVPQHIAIYMENLLAALSDFFNKSYFITKNMNATLTDNKVDGVLPVICFFLEKTGHKIVGIKGSELLEKGELLETDMAVSKKRFRRPYGMRIDFVTNGSDRVRTVHYFSCDLVDDVFRKDSPFYLYLNNLSFETTFIKSASYLMHFKEFSNIRNVVLTKSRFVLEDDTGIPYRYFPAKDWEAQLYGEYFKPVKDFAGVEQKDLKEAYADPAKVKKLPFHLGYHWGSSKDSILYFKRKAPPERR